MSVPEGYKALGKIGISYKGDYNSNTAYERLDAVYHNGSTYLAIKDAPDGAPRDDKINWIYLAKGYDGETVDVAEAEVAFEEAETRENIVSGEKVSTIFGKIKKFFADLTAPAFAQMITTKEDLLATKVTGYVPDAKAVADGFADVNGKLQWKLAGNTVLNGSVAVPSDINEIKIVMISPSSNRAITKRIESSDIAFIYAMSVNSGAEFIGNDITTTADGSKWGASGIVFYTIASHSIRFNGFNVYQGSTMTANPSDSSMYVYYR